MGFPTTAWFEWGTTTSYGNVTPVQTLASGVGATNFSQAITGLAVGVTYHFRAAASNDLGVALGSDQSFAKPAFDDMGAGLTGAASDTSHFVAWGDYDNDGRLDILLAGDGVRQLWRNTGTGFTNGGAAPVFDSLSSSSAAWGDLDNDGRLDFVHSGYAAGSGNGIALVARNTGSGFVNVNTNFPGEYLIGVYAGAAAWGDYILVTGGLVAGGFGCHGADAEFERSAPTAANGQCSGAIVCHLQGHVGQAVLLERASH